MFVSQHESNERAVSAPDAHSEEARVELVQQLW